MTEEKIDIWLVGNTGLRNPRRIPEGFKLYASSSFVGNLHGQENEYGFMRYLHDNGVINNEPGRDQSASHARKWRLMFARNGFIYPKIRRSEGCQEELGSFDHITPFGYSFLQADTYAAQQECFLRAMSVEQTPTTTDGKKYFSPLRWILALMLELERQTGSSELTRTEFALWGHTTDPTYDINYVIENIIDLRKRRKAAPSKRVFDKKEIKERSKLYPKKADNFFDYSDMNMRYLRITGVIQRKGRGLVIVPTKHALVEKLAKTTVSSISLLEAHRQLAEGAPLPSDDFKIAKDLLASVVDLAKSQGVFYDISDLTLDSDVNVNIARLRVEEALQLTNELAYSVRQRDEWREIVEYMRLIEKGGGISREEDDEESRLEVPVDELPAYLEWILWRAELAVDHMITHPRDVRGFKIDSDFLPVSTAGGGRGDLYCEYEDFMLVTEVSMSTSSRQEAMEGEPVRRHVSDAMDGVDCPVYGLFIAKKIDTNTAETFRHGVWYDKKDNKRRLYILPLTLTQFREYFTAMFESESAEPVKFKDLILSCTMRRDVLASPDWKRYIDRTVILEIERIRYGEYQIEGMQPAILPGMTVDHPVLGLGQVLLADVACREGNGNITVLPFASPLPEGMKMLSNGTTIESEDKGLIEIISYQVAFGDMLVHLKKDDLLGTAKLYY